MILKSNCKINLSLSTISRRNDGFTDIETVMYPLDGGLCDIIEVIESEKFVFSSSGILVDCPDSQNLCVKAYALMRDKYNLPPVKIHLHKQIPFGAGLGAGSANAVAVLKLCNLIFNLGLDYIALEDLAQNLGSDTAFFVHNTPAIARGRGEILTPVDLTLKGYYILLIKPNLGISTAEAYKGVKLHTPEIQIEKALTYPIERWKEIMYNDFEDSIFHKLPLLSEIKEQLYANGALYALMSGSGSTIYGIFRDKPEIEVSCFNYLFKINE